MGGMECEVGEVFDPFISFQGYDTEQRLIGTVRRARALTRCYHETQVCAGGVGVWGHVTGGA